MSCGRIAALGGAILLLFPGLCFFWLGTAGMSNKADFTMALGALIVSLCVFGLAGWLTVVAFRKPEVEVTSRTEEPVKPEPPTTE